MDADETSSTTTQGPTFMRQENNLDFLRLAAALFVILGHQYILFGMRPPVGFGSSISTIGVKIFFALSGYLIARSWDFDPNLIGFARKRAVRILPAFFMVIALTTFLLGPLITTLSLSEYAQNSATHRYLLNAAFYIVYRLPGVFDDNLRPGVNGSLWTLPVEMAMYFSIAALGLAFTGSAKRWSVLAVFIALVFAKTWLKPITMGEAPVVYAMNLKAFVNIAVYFMAGAVIWRFSDVFKPRLDLAIAALFTLAVTQGMLFSLIEGFLFSYVVLAFGLLATPILSRAGRYGDFSYGLYLYAFPIQQMTYQWFGRDGPFVLSLAIATLLTLVCAALSWHLLEKPFLSLKKRTSPPIRNARVQSG